MRIVFVGVGAFVGRMDSEYRCAFWTRHPVEVNFDPVLLVPVDLARSPRRATAGGIDWDEVEVDDHRTYDTGGRTTIGPMWPGSDAVGACYLAESYLARLRPEVRPGDVPPGFENEARPYEFRTVLYTNAGGQPVRRYYGFHGEIESETGQSARVKLWDAGTSRIAAPAGTLTIAFDALDQVDNHTSQAGLTEIGVGAGKAKAGAIFLSRGQADVIPLRLPKIPKGEG